MSAPSVGLRPQAEELAAALPPLLVEAERVAATVAQGVHGRRRVGPGESFWQFRRYQTGDAVALIDWRQSAKSRHHFIRENEWEAAESVWLWCDGSASMAYRSAFGPCEKRTRAQVLVLALASLLVRAGERIALVERAEPPASGRIAFQRLATRLLDSASETPSLPPGRPLPRDAIVVLVSDFLEPIEAWGPKLAAFAAQGVHGHLLQVLDPAEEDLPFKGRTLFEGVEQPLKLKVGRAEDLREGYHAALAAHRAMLADECRRLGWTFATHRTDRPPQTALLALYEALAPARPHGARVY